MRFKSGFLYHELTGPNLENSGSIMVMKYPKVSTPDQKIVETWSAVIEAIVSLRRAKAVLIQATPK